MDLKVAGVNGAFRNNRFGSTAPFCPVVSINLDSFSAESLFTRVIPGDSIGPKNAVEVVENEQ